MPASNTPSSDYMAMRGEQLRRDPAYRLGLIDGKAESAAVQADLRSALAASQRRGQNLALENHDLQIRLNGLMRMHVDNEPPPSWFELACDAVQRWWVKVTTPEPCEWADSDAARRDRVGG